MDVDIIIMEGFLDTSLVQYAQLRFKVDPRRASVSVLNRFAPVVKHACFESFLECLESSDITRNSVDIFDDGCDVHVVVVTSEYELLVDLLKSAYLEMPLLLLQIELKSELALNKSKHVRLARDATFPFVLGTMSDTTAKLLVLV